MAHSSSYSHVRYIVWPQIVGSRINPGMPSQYLMCPEVTISQQIHLWEGKSACHHHCESSNALPDHRGTFPGTHVCPAVGCPGRNSRRPGLGWPLRSISEKRNWLFPLGHTAVRGCWMLPWSPGSHCQEMFCCNPSWHVGSWSHQHGNEHGLIPSVIFSVWRYRLMWLCPLLDEPKRPLLSPS